MTMDLGRVESHTRSGDDRMCAMIVRSAALATGCGTALFLRRHDDPEIVARFGEDVAIDQLIAALAFYAGSDLNRILIVDDVAESAISGKALFDTMRIRFLCAVPVVDESGRRQGALLILDGLPRPGLSAAQQYVLQTYAAQLAMVLDLHALRKKVSLPTDDVTTERLRLLESVVVNANDAVLITEAEPVDLPGPRIVYCNRAFERTTGYTEAEILGLTPRILQPSDIDRQSLRRLKEALVAWRPVEVELLNRRKDGTEFWVELSIVPVANEKGWYTHWVSVQRDVSHRKQGEEIATRARIAEAENQALEAEIRERMRIEAQLFHDAFHDDLTKLRNRAYFMDQLASALRPGRDEARTVLFLDLDGFKMVNDSLGHRAGDDLLIATAGRLQACVSQDDVLARIGGDEFAVLLAGGLDVGIEVAERILETLREPVMLGTQRVFPSCSVGIAQSSDSALTPDAFLRNADIAMYQAKKRGTGGHMVFEASMHKDVSDALALQMDLREAVTRGEFRVSYQLICDPATSLISGFEALVRWQHPDRGLVAPLAFVPVAEEIGVIRDIGRFVFQEACVRLHDWNKLFPGHNIHMNINVSGDELRDPGFVSYLRSVMQQTGVRPDQLQLEITESVFLRQPEVIGTVLEAIRTLGVRIALDDFGTGFSSLSYIDQYPIDAIKIDRSFVARMLSHRRTLAIIETIIRLGQALDLQIVAEGVETDEQRRMLTSLQCSHAQGYLFAKPMSSADATTALGSQHFQRTKGALGLQGRLGRALA